jgi:hypothetical protein
VNDNTHCHRFPSSPKSSSPGFVPAMPLQQLAPFHRDARDKAQA